MEFVMAPTFLLRHLFFYLVEGSPGDWTEENIGEKFMLLIRCLQHPSEKH